MAPRGESPTDSDEEEVREAQVPTVREEPLENGSAEEPDKRRGGEKIRFEGKEPERRRESDRGQDRRDRNSERDSHRERNGRDDRGDDRDRRERDYRRDDRRDGRSDIGRSRMRSDRDDDRDRGGRYGGRDRDDHRGQDRYSGRDRDGDRRGPDRGGRGGDSRRESDRGDRRGDDSRRESDRGDRRGDERDGRAERPIAAETQAVAPAEAEAPKERVEKPAGKAGGVYIPPFKLAQMLREAKDETSVQYQRLRWDALRKSLNGLINKVNITNIKEVLPEIFGENLSRGKGLFCRSMMKSQMASPTFTSVFAALVAVINTKFPEIGQLLLHRLILQFKRAFKRNDKPICLAVTKFIGHLVNQQVADDMIAFEVAILLLENPSEDSVEIALEFFKTVGAYLQDVNKEGFNIISKRLTLILAEGQAEKRTCMLIQNFLEVIARGGKAAGGRLEELGFESVPKELDLVEINDQITHQVSLEESDTYNAQIALDLFKPDDNYQEEEKKYEAIRREILGEDEEDESDDDEDGDSDDESSDEEDGGGAAAPGGATQKIQDNTETNLINLRRTIYLTIMSALDFEEAGHKLMKIQLAPGQEQEIVTMVIECCSQEKTYSKYYGLLAQRFCLLKREYQACFEECFRRQYALIHRLETNKLRNVARFFGHLLATDAISWEVIDSVRLTEDDTTSSSRIFIKVLFQDLSENMGLRSLNERLQDPSLAAWFGNLFPRDSPRNMRFSINFFTSIGLGGLTDALRRHLAELPKILAAQREAAAAAAAEAGEGSSDDSSDDSSSSSDSDSDSDSSSDSDSDSVSSSDSDSSDSSSDSSSDNDSSDSDETPPPAKKKAAAAAAKAPLAKDKAREEPVREKVDSRRAAEKGRERDDGRREERAGRGSPERRRGRAHEETRGGDRSDRVERHRKRERDEPAAKNGAARKYRAVDKAVVEGSTKIREKAVREEESSASEHERWDGGVATDAIDVDDRWTGGE